MTTAGKAIARSMTDIVNPAGWMRPKGMTRYHYFRGRGIDMHQSICGRANDGATMAVFMVTPHPWIITTSESSICKSCFDSIQYERKRELVASFVVIAEMLNRYATLVKDAEDDFDTLTQIIVNLADLALVPKIEDHWRPNPSLDYLERELATLCVILQNVDIEDFDAADLEKLHHALDVCRDQFPCATDDEDEEESSDGE